MENWMQLLQQAVEEAASDVFFVAGKAPCRKIEGRILPMGDHKLLPPDTEQMVREIYEKAQRSMDTFLECGDDDFSFAVPGLARFRVSAYKQRGSMAAVVRIVSFSIPANLAGLL